MTVSNRKMPLDGQPLSLREAYIAMYYFVRAYWERGGKVDSSVTLLLSDLGPSTSSEDLDIVDTSDPAFWSDWLTAVRRALVEGFPKQL